MLSLSSHTHVMTEVQGPGAEVLHWAEKVYYKQKPKKRQKRRYYNSLYYQGRKERNQRAKLPKEKVRAPAKKVKGWV